MATFSGTFLFILSSHKALCVLGVLNYPSHFVKPYEEVMLAVFCVGGLMIALEPLRVATGE